MNVVALLRSVDRMTCQFKALRRSAPTFAADLPADPTVVFAGVIGSSSVMYWRFPNHAHIWCRSRPPFLRHALAGVAPPALNESAPRKSTPVDLLQLVFVQPRLCTRSRCCCCNRT